MPKLDQTHIYERLLNRLEDLKAGKEVAKRDIEALLNDKQIRAMDEAWEKQQELRKKHRPKNEAEELKLGWKTKRQIYIDAYEQAINEARCTQQTDWQKKLEQEQLKATKTYLDGYFKARADGKSRGVAENIAKNDLVKAGFKVQRVAKGLTKRDREINEIEDALRKMLGKKGEKD